MDFKSMYEHELTHPDPLYRRGLQRGFEGPTVVPDEEHHRLLNHPDASAAIAYRNGLLSGQNLELCASMAAKLPPREA